MSWDRLQRAEGWLLLQREAALRLHWVCGAPTGRWSCATALSVPSAMSHKSRWPLCYRSEGPARPSSSGVQRASWTRRSRLLTTTYVSSSPVCCYQKGAAQGEPGRGPTGHGGWGRGGSSFLVSQRLHSLQISMCSAAWKLSASCSFLLSYGGFIT